MCIDRQAFFYFDKRGEKHTVARACGHCWQCLRNEVDDWVGRCLCEAAGSSWVWVLSLSYRDGPDREADQAHRVIFPPHFQLFVKNLRTRHNLRYFVVGEYGGKSGRAHFHVVLFGKGSPPEWSQTAPAGELEKPDWYYPDEWPHGHVQVKKEVAEGDIRYNVKYILKGEKGKIWVSPSKKPPLGHDYFMALAARDHRNQVWPQHFGYIPPGSIKPKGRSYFMTGVTRRNYLNERYRLAQAEGYAPDLHERGSENLLASLEKLDRWQGEQETKAFPALGKYQAHNMFWRQVFAARRVSEDAGKFTDHKASFVRRMAEKERKVRDEQAAARKAELRGVWRFDGDGGEFPPGAFPDND